MLSERSLLGTLAHCTDAFCKLTPSFARFTARTIIFWSQKKNISWNRGTQSRSFTINKLVLCKQSQIPSTKKTAWREISTEASWSYNFQLFKNLNNNISILTITLLKVRENPVTIYQRNFKDIILVYLCIYEFIDPSHSGNTTKNTSFPLPRNK